ALDPLRAGIPVGNFACGGQHADRIVGDALNQQTEPLLAFMQRLLRQLAFGDVAGNLGESDELAFRIANRIDDDAGPEARAVLADAPTLRFELSFLERNLERAFWEIGCLILRRIKTGKMLADDFFCGISLESLGAGIPAGDETLGIQQIDGVVAYAGNQELKALFGRNMRFLHDLRETHKNKKYLVMDRGKRWPNIESGGKTYAGRMSSIAFRHCAGKCHCRSMACSFAGKPYLRGRSFRRYSPRRNSTGYREKDSGYDAAPR